jgi:arginyl-tRNA synthetase
MIYVAASQQHLHFSQLFELLRLTGTPIRSTLSLRDEADSCIGMFQEMSGLKNVATWASAWSMA